MRNLRWPFLIVCLVVFVFVNPIAGFSQPGDPGNPDAPITGIEVLIAIGGALGIKKIFQNRKKNNS